jgi:RHS repeat-associated protein
MNQSFDQAGSVTLISDSQGGTISQSWDGDNLAAQNYQNGTTVALMSLSYDPANELTAVTRYSDLLGSTVVGTESRSYSGGLITSILDKNGSGTTLASFGYSYNSSGELTQEVNNGATTACGYDAGGQLTVAGSQSQSYDTNGNRSASSITTVADNRLLGDGTWNYSYSTGGNLISRTQVSGSLSWSYAYDAANELTLAVETSGTTTLVSASYSYDAFGNRIGETVTQNSSTTTTHNSYLAVNPPMVGADATNWRLYADLNSSNTVQTRYIAGMQPDQWFARVDTSGVEWLLTDNLGSIRNVLNSAGGVIDTIAYDAFGNITSESNASNGGRLKYAGYQVDAWAGMDLSGARYYLPSAQIWVSPDPSGLSTGSNLYVYAGNDPLNATDPTGLVIDSVRAATLVNPELAAAAAAALGTGGYVATNQGSGLPMTAYDLERLRQSGEQALANLNSYLKEQSEKAQAFAKMQAMVATMQAYVTAKGTLGISLTHFIPQPFLSPGVYYYTKSDSAAGICLNFRDKVKPKLEIVSRMQGLRKQR